MQDRVVFLDYLRAIAALMVFLVHWSGIGSSATFPTDILHITINPEGGLNILGRAFALWAKIAVFPPIDVNFASGGVLIFFLVSGFVIPMSVEKYDLASFGIRRAARLLPPLWATIILWLILNAILQHIWLADGQPYSLRALITNALLIQDWFWEPHVDLSFWTLVVEAKFYFLMALMVVMAKRITLHNIAILVGFLMILSVPFIDTPEGSDYAALFQRSNETGYWWVFYFYRVLNNSTPYIIYMLIGTVAFLWYKNRASLPQAVISIAMLFAVFATAFLIGPNGFAQSYYVGDGAKVLAIFGAAIAAQRMGLLNNSAFGLRPILLFLGNISYSLYLTHGMIGMSLVYVLWHWSDNLPAAMTVAGILIFTLSWAMEKWIGAPAIMLGSKIAAYTVPTPDSETSAPDEP